MTYRTLVLAVTLAGLPLAPQSVAAKPAASLQTVNSYTPAQQQSAVAAARNAGYDPGTVLFAQAGNFFFNATRDGEHYGLTVTPDGKVYASKPVK